MKLTFVLLATALLSSGILACGGTGKGASSESPTSSNAVTAGVATGASLHPGSNPTIIPDTAATRGYLNDGDHDHIGDPDGDNSHDNDKDAYYDYKPDDNGNYHDSDDLVVIQYGRAASAAQARAITAVVKRYYATAAAGDGAAACSQLVPSLVKATPVVYGQFGAFYLRGAKTCPGVTARLFKHFHGQLAHPVHVTSVRVQGDNGLALFGSRTMPASYMTLMREGGAWKITRILGSPLP